jgi:hypothetical protein
MVFENGLVKIKTVMLSVLGGSAFTANKEVYPAIPSMQLSFLILDTVPKNCTVLYENKMAQHVAPGSSHDTRTTRKTCSHR